MNVTKCEVCTFLRSIKLAVYMFRIFPLSLGSKYSPRQIFQSYVVLLRIETNFTHIKWQVRLMYFYVTDFRRENGTIRYCEPNSCKHRINLRFLREECNLLIALVTRGSVVSRDIRLQAGW